MTDNMARSGWVGESGPELMRMPVSVRSLTHGVQRRDLPTGELHTRDADDGTREVSGVGVPFNAPIEIYGIREQFAPGSIDDDSTPLLLWRHDAPIGRVVEHHSDSDGWHHRSTISDTAQGREAHTLAKDGVIDRFSVGFEPIEWREEHDEDNGTVTITHTKVKLREVSLVPFPAYDTARLTGVRSDPNDRPDDPDEHHPHPTQEDNMSTETRDRDGLATAESVDEIRSAMDDLTRRVEVGLTRTTEDEGHTTGTRSMGELVQAIASGDEVATRAYEGAVTGDFILQDQWIGSLVQILHKRQTVASTFARGPLPAKGLTVEYAELDDDTTAVGEQANEGDDLDFGKVSVTTKTAPVSTLGGWTTMSRQAIERTENVSILDTTFSAMAERYGQAVERKARTAFNGALSGADTVTGTLDSQDHVVAAILDLAEHFDDLGLSLDGVFVDKATFLALYGVSADKRILQVTGAPDDKVGTVSVNTMSASVSGLSVRVLPNADANTFAAYDASAIRTLESAGAPVRLQDDNIVNLSRDFSVYGYAASFVQRPSGIVVLDQG